MYLKTTTTRLFTFLVLILGYANLSAQDRACGTTIPELADSCADAPLFCHEFLGNGLCSNNQNATAITDGLDSLDCSIENNVWIKIPVCDSLVNLSFFLDNCQTNDGMEITLMESISCDSFSFPGATCQIVPANSLDTLEFDGLTPGNIYYLMLDGVNGNVCDFEIHSITGIHETPIDTIGPPPPDTNQLVFTTLEEASISGPECVCVGEPATFVFTPAVCGFVQGDCDGSGIVGGGGSRSRADACFGPEICYEVSDIELDTIVIWDFPDGTTFIGDSTGYEVTVIYDEDWLLQQFDPDTLANGFMDTIPMSVHAEIEIIPVVLDSIGQDTIFGGDNIYCNCSGGYSIICGSCKSSADFDYKVIFEIIREDIWLCSWECESVDCGGEVTLCPGQVTSCVIPCVWQFITANLIEEEYYFESYEICPGECVSTMIGEFCNAGWYSDYVPWWGQCGAWIDVYIEEYPETPDDYLGIQLLCPGDCYTNPFGVDYCSTGNFSWIASDPNGCSYEQSVDIEIIDAQDEYLGLQTLCPGDCYTNPFGVDFCSPGSYSWTATMNGCPIQQSVDIEIIVVNNEYLGLIELCPGDCFTNLKGVEYCDPGSYSWVAQGNGCSWIQSIDIALFDVQNEYLGIVELCPGDCYTNPFGVDYCGDGVFLWSAIDANGCEFQQSIEIINFDAPDEYLGIVELCPGDCYTNPFGVDYCAAGNYSWIAADANGCDFQQSIDLEYFVVQDEYLGIVELCPGDCYTNPFGVDYCTAGNYSWNATDANGCDFEQSVDIEFLQPDPINLGPITEECSADATTYTISFAIYGGQTPYHIDGNAITGSFYISQPIPNGMSYSFEVKDDGQCSSVEILSGAYQCPLQCVAEAGTLNNTPQRYCPDGQVKILELTPAVTDNTTYAQYWISKSQAPQASDVITMNVTGEWAYDSNIFEFGEEYQTARVVGPLLNTGLVDLDAICSAITPGPTIIFYDYPVLDLPHDEGLTLNCINELFNVEGEPTSGSGQFTLEWQLDNAAINTLAAVEIKQPGMYQLLVRDEITGCETKDQIQVLEDKVAPEFELGDDLLINCSLSNAEISGETVLDLSQVQWEAEGPNGPLLSTNPMINIAVDEPGWYHFIAQNPINGCTHSDSLIVHPADPPTAAIVDITTRDCPEDTERADLTLTEVIGGTAPFDISFNGAELTPNQTFVDIPDGEYVIHIMDALGCAYQEEIVIASPELFTSSMEEEIILEWGEHVVLQPNFNFTPENVTWYIEESEMELSSPVLNHTYAGEQQIELVATTEEGCVFSQMIQLQIKADNDPLFIPNAFSPNGDAANEYFEIFASSFVERVEFLRVYDRWGGVVFAEEAYAPGSEAGRWNGKLNNKEINPGVYVYQCKVLLRNGETKSYSGDVLLMK